MFCAIADEYADQFAITPLRLLVAAAMCEKRPAKPTPLLAEAEKVTRPPVARTANATRTLKASGATRAVTKKVVRWRDQKAEWLGVVEKITRDRTCLGVRNYSRAFNANLKKDVRRRDGYKCQLCGVPQAECRRALAVHHIDYDKKNSNPLNLIALCRGCHSRTNADRKRWTALFRAMTTAGGGNVAGREHGGRLRRAIERTQPGAVGLTTRNIWRPSGAGG